MAGISIGESVGEGFGLIAKRPVAILAWGLARVLLAASVFAVMAPVYLSIFGAVAAQAASGAATPPNLASLQAIQAMQGVNFLLSIVSLFLSSVLYCAVFRAVLFPEQSAFAYLRLGAAELFYFLFFFCGLIALAIGMVVLLIPVFIVVGISAAAHAPALGALFMLAALLGIFVLFIWVLCRLSMVGPMMVEDGKFHLLDAWALTRGHVWSLFGIAILLVVILIAIEVVIGVVTLALGFGWLTQAAGGAANLRSFFLRPPADILSALAPALMIGAVFSVPISGALMAILVAPWARVYRDLRPSTDVAATFA
jgi:hypothetical protein